MEYEAAPAKKGRQPGTGRKKVEIKKIVNKYKRITTFSKRRNGLFSKAGDLCVLCGAEIAVITFSPNGRPFVFGHPSADAVIDRFLNQSTATDNGEKQAEGRGGFWWNAAIDNMGLEELVKFRDSMEELKRKASMRADEIMMRKSFMDSISVAPMGFFFQEEFQMLL